MIPQVE